MRIKKLLLYVFLVSFFFTGINFAGDTLKVMTYNLQGMKPGTDPETRILKIIEKLIIINPDIIGLQEINEFLNGTKNQGQRITDSLSAYFNIPYYFYQQATHLSWDNKFRESIGIISKYPVHKKDFKQLVNGVFPRKVVWNYIETPLGMINMFNTHLSFNSSSVRNQQAKQIYSYINQQADEYPGIAEILTGDFNDTPNATSILTFTSSDSDTFYFDTFKEVNPGAAGNTVPAAAPNSRIDYIFYRNTGEINIISSHVVMGTSYDGVNYCSDHRGVLTKFALSATGVSNNSNENIPLKIQLYQNYPNPFNPATIIEYSIPPAGDLQAASQQSRAVQLNIYDVLGKLVKTLVDEEQPPGNYKVSFNSKNLPSGVYLYQLKTGTTLKTLKMTIVK